MKKDQGTILLALVAAGAAFFFFSRKKGRAVSSNQAPAGQTNFVPSPIPVARPVAGAPVPNLQTQLATAGTNAIIQAVSNLASSLLRGGSGSGSGSNRPGFSLGGGGGGGGGSAGRGGGGRAPSSSTGNTISDLGPTNPANAAAEADYWNWVSDQPDQGNAAAEADYWNWVSDQPDQNTDPGYDQGNTDPGYDQGNTDPGYDYSQDS